MRNRRGQRKREVGRDLSNRTVAREQDMHRTADLDDDEELRMLEDEELRLVDRLEAISNAIESLKNDTKEVKNDATRR